MPSLGIKSTKYGPGDKKRAYLVDGVTAFYIVVAVLVSASVLFYLVAQEKENIWELQHELMDDKYEAEKFSHEAAVQILQMAAELEVHLAEEIEWDTQERQYFERVQELEEGLRIKTAATVAALKEEITKALKNTPAAQQQSVLSALEPVVKALSKDTDDAIGQFGDEIETLGETYLEYVKKETKRDKDRLAVLHEKVTSFSKRAGLAQVNTLSDNELESKLYKFLKMADAETETAYAMELPDDVVHSLQQWHDQFQYLDPVTVQQDIQKVLFPNGKQDQESKYGAPQYRGGSLEAYLDRVLFLHKYRTELHPTLHASARKWKDHEITSAEFLQYMLNGVEKGLYPAKWMLGF